MESRMKESYIEGLASHGGSESCAGARKDVVYYWIQRGLVEARRLNAGSPYWITINAEREQELVEWVRGSSKIRKHNNGDSEAVL